MARIRDFRTDDETSTVTVNVGDDCGFKDDIETYGTITKIAGSWLTIESTDAHGNTHQHLMHASGCWLD